MSEDSQLRSRHIAKASDTELYRTPELKGVAEEVEATLVQIMAEAAR